MATTTAPEGCWILAREQLFPAAGFCSEELSVKQGGKLIIKPLD